MKEVTPYIDPEKIWQEVNVDPANMNAANVQTLASYQLTDNEIAAIFNTTVKRVRERHGPAIDRGRLIGKAALRVAQIRTAGKGNALSQIWSGKQWLNQQDKPEAKQEPERDTSIIKGRIATIFGGSVKTRKKAPQSDTPEPDVPIAQSA